MRSSTPKHAALAAALVLSGCLSAAHPDTGDIATTDALPIGVWLYVWPEHPMPADAPSSCVAPQCEQALLLQHDGAVVLSQTDASPVQRGSWSGAALTLDGLACTVSVIDSRFPTFSVDCEGAYVKLGRWPYDDPPHERSR